MGYHISVWDGETPHSLDHGYLLWRQLYAQAHPRLAPTQRLLAFVRRLEQEWGSDIREDLPWRNLPLEAEASGPLFDTALTFSSAADAVPRIATLAQSEGLVFYDPQYPELRVPFRASWELP